MELSVHVIEARGLLATRRGGSNNSYVRLKLGKCRFKTKVVKKDMNPSWDEEFKFLAGELAEELVLAVFNQDKYFNDDFLGQVRMPLSKVFSADNMSLGKLWHPLQPKNKKSKNKERGEICLNISLFQKNLFYGENVVVSRTSSVASNSDTYNEQTKETFLSTSDSNMESSSELELEETKLAKVTKMNAPFVDVLSQFFLFKDTQDVPTLATNDLDSLEEEKIIMETKYYHNTTDGAEKTFDELMSILMAKDEGDDMPESLLGGILLDQSYVIAPADLNLLLFSPTSNFWQSIAELQGTTGLQSESWRLDGKENRLKRVITYTKAASKLIKAVKAVEEQTYLKVDGMSFAVLASVSIPDVPCGSYFKTEVLYCIRPDLQCSSQEKSSNLQISWRINFVHSTIMKGMIENGAKQGLMESYTQVAEMLSKSVKLVSLESFSYEKEQILPSPEIKKGSKLKLIIRLLSNITIGISVVIWFYVLFHIFLVNTYIIQGIEFIGLDLPDSIGEILFSTALVLLGRHTIHSIGRFLHSIRQNGNYYNVKGHGDGWMLTVALIEGANIATMHSGGYSNPYVTFTCNGQTKTSSIKYKINDPQWNEIFEFDAMDNVPSIMHVVVYDVHGDMSLGHAEVNFVKNSPLALADIWIPLEGKIGQTCQSKLHLRIFLSNTKGNKTIVDYLSKMEKKIGKKINIRSPQTNSTFQKLFDLSPEEFLINDFSCHLKRKMPLQGRLFISPRIMGFHANIFGQKIKFFFVWEDIDDIQICPPSLASVGSPSLVVTLRKGRGMDAKHGAKAMDQDGRLKFHFHSFVSFHVASRTTMALWKERSLNPEWKMLSAETEISMRSATTEENASFSEIEDS